MFDGFVSGNQFIIVGGGNYGIQSSVEALNETQHLSCSIRSYPFAVSDHASTVTSSGILVCGGYKTRKNCYEYKPTSNTWARMPPMTTARRGFGMIYQKQKVWVVGGSGGPGSDTSMEIYDPNTNKWTQQSIPFSISQHCMTKLSSNQFILTGGRSNGV